MLFGVWTLVYLPFLWLWIRSQMVISNFSLKVQSHAALSKLPCWDLSKGQGDRILQYFQMCRLCPHPSKQSDTFSLVDTDYHNHLLSDPSVTLTSLLATVSPPPSVGPWASPAVGDTPCRSEPQLHHAHKRQWLPGQCWQSHLSWRSQGHPGQWIPIREARQTCQLCLEVQVDPSLLALCHALQHRVQRWLRSVLFWLCIHNQCPGDILCPQQSPTVSLHRASELHWHRLKKPKLHGHYTQPKLPCTAGTEVLTTLPHATWNT